MSLLSRSKLMVSLDGVNISPTAVYHAALMGIVTILPENHLIKSLGYPEALLLNRTEITHNKLYRYMRYMSTVKDKISDVIENHQKYIDDILSVLDTHFEADQFLTLIENIKKIKNNGKRRKHMVGGEIPTKND
jgi:hypothetical protein